MSRRVRRIVALQAVSVLALTLTLTGCSSSSDGTHIGPGGPLPLTHLALSAQVGQAGLVALPGTAKTVTLDGTGRSLSVDLDVFPGVGWSQTGQGTAAVLQDQGPMGQSAPAPCDPVSSACQTTWSERYLALAPGTSTLTWTLFADAANNPSATPNTAACPAASTVPLPKADDGCVLGHVTITVVVTQ